MISKLEIKRKEGQIQVQATAPGTDCLLQVTTAKGDSVKLLTLTRQQALHCWRGKLWGQTSSGADRLHADSHGNRTAAALDRFRQAGCCHLS